MFPHLLIDKIVKQNAGGFDGLVADLNGIYLRLAGGGFGGRTQKRIAAGRFGGNYVACFVNQNLNGDLPRCAHLSGGRRIRGLWQINGASV